MNYSNDFYSQNTYGNQINLDHFSNQLILIEAIDSLVLEPSTEQSVDYYDELQ